MRTQHRVQTVGGTVFPTTRSVFRNAVLVDEGVSPLEDHTTHSWNGRPSLRRSGSTRMRKSECVYASGEAAHQRLWEAWSVFRVPTRDHERIPLMKHAYAPRWRIPSSSSEVENGDGTNAHEEARKAPARPGTFCRPRRIGPQSSTARQGIATRRAGVPVTGAIPPRNRVQACVTQGSGRIRLTKGPGITCRRSVLAALNAATSSDVLHASCRALERP
jgi:hypothetical protein